jgi:DNA helicase-2/ATP-dependent DNA helicase PcrA
MEEERRLAYVAFTRAEEELYLTYAEQRTLFGQTGWNPVSRFIEDLGIKYTAPTQADVDDLFLDPALKGAQRQWSRPSAGVRAQHGDGARRGSLDASPAGREKWSRRSRDDDEPTFVPDPIELKPGDTVRHQIFGRGQVESVDDTVVTVKFDGGKTRKLNVAFAPLEKI